MATREQIMAALFTLLTGSGSYKTVGRRLRDPEGMDPSATPALFLVEHQDAYERPENNLPPIRRMHAFAIVYVDVGQDQTAIPAQTMNALLDGIDAAMVPDRLLTGKLTLGGLCDACLIEGEVTRSSGDVTGKCLAVVPIVILLP